MDKIIKMGESRNIPASTKAPESEKDEAKRLEDLMAKKKEIEKEIRELMATEIKFGRASIRFPRKSKKREAKWSIKYTSKVDGVESVKERMVTLYTCAQEEELASGIDELIKDLQGLKEQIGKELAKQKPDKTPKADKAEPKAEPKTGTKNKGGKK